MINDKGQNESENPFNNEFSKKIVINESILLRKIQLIRRYYEQAKKAFVFFGQQSFDTKAIQKDIFEQFFSTKFYQGTQPIQLDALDYIICESNFRFICKKNKITSENVINSYSNDSELQKHQSKPSQFQSHQYHYFGQILKSNPIQSALNSHQQQQPSQESNQFNLHGFGLLINFQVKQFINNPSQGYEINCYFGQFINGLKHGSGMDFKHHPNTNDFMQIYIGNFTNGNYDDDQAIWVNIKLVQKQSPSQQNLSLEYIDKYYGAFVNGMKHGKGKISSSQLFYSGDWRFDKPEGMGQIWTSTSYYKGLFKSGLKHRNGKELFKNGDIYEGTYSNNKPTGLGKYFWKNGSFYEGEFKNGLRDGKGLWKSGSQSYEGNYLNDKKCGQGIYYWNDGQTYYKGHFYEDLRHGYGQMYWDNRKSAYKGKWKQGFQDGYGEFFQLQLSSNQLKLIKKGQFLKGNIIQQIALQKQTSVDPSPQKSLASDSDGLQANQFSEEKSQQIPKKPINPNKKPIKLRKPSLIKGIKLQHNPLDDTHQQIQRYANTNERKRFVKSQNQNYNEFMNKQEALKHIHAKQRYLMDVQKNPIEKQHLYGSVYLIKSGRKRLSSSVHNYSRPHNQDIQEKIGYKLPQTSSANPVNLTKNNRSHSYSNTQPVNKLAQNNNKSQKLQQIKSKRQFQRPFQQQKIKKQSRKQKNQLGAEQVLILPKPKASNQGRYPKARYFDPEDEKIFAQLQPLIVWNNFSKNPRRSFLK